MIFLAGNSLLKKCSGNFNHCSEVRLAVHIFIAKCYTKLCIKWMFSSVLNRVLKFSLRNEVCVKIHLMSNYNITYRKYALVLPFGSYSVVEGQGYYYHCYFLEYFFLVHSILIGCVHIWITRSTPGVLEGYLLCLVYFQTRSCPRCA